MRNFVTKFGRLLKSSARALAVFFAIGLSSMATNFAYSCNQLQFLFSRETESGWVNNTFRISRFYPDQNIELYGQATYYPNGRTIEFQIITRRQSGGVEIHELDFTGPQLIQRLMAAAQAAKLPIDAVVSFYDGDPALGMDTIFKKLMDLVNPSAEIYEEDPLTWRPIATAAYHLRTAQILKPFGFVRPEVLSVTTEGGRVSSVRLRWNRAQTRDPFDHDF